MCQFFLLKILFIQVLIMLYAKFQPSTMSGSGQKVCGGGSGGCGWLRPIIVLSLSPSLAEQNSSLSKKCRHKYQHLTLKYYGLCFIKVTHSVHLL